MDSEAHIRKQIVHGMRSYATLDDIKLELNTLGIPLSRTVRIIGNLERECPPFFAQYRFRQLVMEQKYHYDSLWTRLNLLLQGMQLAGSGQYVPEVQAQLSPIDRDEEEVARLTQVIHSIDPIVLAEPRQDWTTLGNAIPNPLLEYGINEVALQQLHFNNNLQRNAQILREHAAQLRKSAHLVVVTNGQNANLVYNLNRQIQRLRGQPAQRVLRHNARIQQLQAQQAERVQQHNAQIRQLQAQQAQQVQRHNAQIQWLQAQPAQQVQRHNAQIQQLQAQEAERVQWHNAQIQRHNAQIQRLQAQQAELVQWHNAQIQRLQAQPAQRHNAQIQQLQAQPAQPHNAQIQQLQALLQAEQNNAQIQTLQVQQAEQVQRHNAQIQQLQAEEAEQVQQHNAQIQQLQALLQAEKNNEIEAQEGSEDGPKIF